jgi:hypothetical protein
MDKEVNMNETLELLANVCFLSYKSETVVSKCTGRERRGITLASTGRGEREREREWEREWERGRAARMRNNLVFPETCFLLCVIKRGVHGGGQLTFHENGREWEMGGEDGAHVRRKRHLETKMVDWKTFSVSEIDHVLLQRSPCGTKKRKSGKIIGVGFKKIEDETDG